MVWPLGTSAHLLPDPACSGQARPPGLLRGLAGVGGRPRLAPVNQLPADKLSSRGMGPPDAGLICANRGQGSTVRLRI